MVTRMRDLPDTRGQTDMRPPSHVMRLEQLGAMFPTRLSFLRVLTRRLLEDGATLTRKIWDIDAQGFGHAVYTIAVGGYDYALVAVSQDLPEAQRTDRVIATAWDAAFVLYDGLPSAEEIRRICAQAPKQEAGRFSERDLVLSRANKSIRLWAEIVEALRSGQQPDARRINEIGYLMRTTAVYGNGKFGIADRTLYATRPGLDGPFAAEMLTVWMIRAFTHDLIEHVGGAPLDRALKRHLGIGNATGLGMAPFLVTHPVLLNNWMMVRETALARVLGVERIGVEKVTLLLRLAARVAQHLQDWRPSEPRDIAAVVQLRQEFGALIASELWGHDALLGPSALRLLVQQARRVGPELEELVVALVLEPFGDLVDGLACCLADAVGPVTEPAPTTGAIAAQIERHCAWALQVDYAERGECAQFWYVSEEKLEPRLGQRFEEPGAELESPLDIGRRIAALQIDLPATSEPLAAFLQRHPEHLLAVERVQIAARYPYAEIQGNLIAATCRPIDMLRAKLAMFGAAKFDPKSDLWTRITLAQGAPLADELGGPQADDWWLPVAAQ